MEQKTEASQAVERRAEYEAFCEWVRETPGKPFADMAWEAWQDGRARLRAAIKAQSAPTEARATLKPIGDPHTESKTNHIIERDGYKKVGYVLENAAGDYCLSAQSAVRWLSQPHYWRLMHEQDGSLFAAKAPTEAQGKPVMWLEAEASAKGQPLRHVIGSMLYSTRMHTTKPEVLNNSLWPLYEHPAPVEAQGEDSARLDAEQIEADAAAFELEIGWVPNRIITQKTPWGWRYRRAVVQGQFMAFRARASAETGGANAQPPYPEGDVVGACVCGSWPGGKCLKCPWIPAETGRVKS